MAQFSVSILNSLAQQVSTLFSEVEKLKSSQQHTPASQGPVPTAREADSPPLWDSQINELRNNLKSVRDDIATLRESKVHMENTLSMKLEHLVTRVVKEKIDSVKASIHAEVLAAVNSREPRAPTPEAQQPHAQHHAREVHVAGTVVDLDSLASDLALLSQHQPLQLNTQPATPGSNDGGSGSAANESTDVTVRRKYVRKPKPIVSLEDDDGHHAA